MIFFIINQSQWPTASRSRRESPANQPTNQLIVYPQRGSASSAFEGLFALYTVKGTYHTRSNALSSSILSCSDTTALVFIVN